MNERRDILLQRSLRFLVVAMTALTLVAIVLALLPGHEIYQNGVLVERRAAGGAGFAMFACWLIAPGLVVWLHPKLSFAVMWSGLAWAGTLMLVGASMSFDTDLIRTHVRLWPATAMQYAMTPVLLTILGGIPIAAALYKLGIRRADRKAAALANPLPPVARVVTHHRLRA